MPDEPPQLGLFDAPPEPAPSPPENDFRQTQKIDALTAVCAQSSDASADTDQAPLDDIAEAWQDLTGEPYPGRERVLALFARSRAAGRLKEPSGRGW